MSDSPRCATCRWWAPEPEADGWASASGPRAEPDGWLLCQLTRRDWYGDPPPENVLMMVDGYEVRGLFTAPGFGCVHHEAREDSL